MNELHQKNIKEAPDSGRTMLEMLGTLAIIGVLSVGGVTGYGRAITAYSAHGVADAAQKAAVRIASDIQMSTAPVSPSVSDAIKTPGTGYVVQPADVTGSTTNSINSDAKYFSLVAGDAVQMSDGTTGATLPKEVARNLLEKALNNWTSVHGAGVKVNGGSTTWVTSLDQFDQLVGDNTTVIMIFVYASDLSLRTGDLFTNLPDGAIGSSASIGGDGNEGGDEEPTDCAEPCGECLKCEEGQCVADDEKDGRTCATSDNKQGQCNAGVCQAVSTCPAGTTVAEHYEGTDALSDGECICTSYTTNQCGLGYYCNFAGMTPWDDPLQGKCTDLTNDCVSTVEWEYRNAFSFAACEYESMDWWSANSWCIGQGYPGLISYATLSEGAGETVHESWGRENCPLSHFPYAGGAVYWTREENSQFPKRYNLFYVKTNERQCWVEGDGNKVFYPTEGSCDGMTADLSYTPLCESYVARH